MARTPMNEHCSAVILNKLPKKLGDPGKFLIPCDFPEMDECLALADLGASINLMPLSVWKKLFLPELTPTCMTLELADCSITQLIGIAEDVDVKTGRALIDVYEGELTLRVGKEAVTFNLDQTSRYSSNYDDMTVNRIDVIEMACEEYSQEVLGFSDVTTRYSDIISKDLRRGRSRSHKGFEVTLSEPSLETLRHQAPPVAMMDNNRTMAQLLEAPTEGYEDSIVVPEITDNFELKHGLLTLVQNKQFFGHDKEDPHAHIRLFTRSLLR
ncbi:reverse transcriptase domain-containing protein [Tanacetum coccineum]